MVIFSQLCTVRGLLQKTVPILLKLNQKAAAALKERDEHITARDQAIEERKQVRYLWFNMDTCFFKYDDGCELQGWLFFKLEWTQQMEEEWNQTNLDLQTAREQIGDLNLQVTILTSGKTLK